MSFWMYERQLYVVINSVAVAIQTNKIGIPLSVERFNEHRGTFPYRWSVVSRCKEMRGDHLKPSNCIQGDAHLGAVSVFNKAIQECARSSPCLVFFVQDTDSRSAS